METMVLDSSLVTKLRQVKIYSNKSYTQIARETGLTNVYVAQLLRGQTHLKLDEDVVSKLQSALPGLTDELVEQLKLIEEPDIRLHEAAMHFGESIKDIIEEDFGDSILSSADLACSVDKVEGVDGKDSVIISLKGKHSPYTEQLIVEPIKDKSSEEEKRMTITTLEMLDYVKRHNYLALYELKHNKKNDVQIIQPRNQQRADGCTFAALARQIEYQLRIIYAEAEVPTTLRQGICYINHEEWEDELIRRYPNHDPRSRWKLSTLLNIARDVGVPLYNGERHIIQEYKGWFMGLTVNFLKTILDRFPIVGVIEIRDDYPLNGEYVYEGVMGVKQEEVVDDEGVKTTVGAMHAVVLLDLCEYEGATYVAYQNSYGDLGLSMCPNNISWLRFETIKEICYGISAPPMHPPPILRSLKQNMKFRAKSDDFFTKFNRLGRAFAEGRQLMDKVSALYCNGRMGQSIKELEKAVRVMVVVTEIVKEVEPFIDEYGTVEKASSIGSSPIGKMALEAAEMINGVKRLQMELDHQKQVLKYRN